MVFKKPKITQETYKFYALDLIKTMTPLLNEGIGMDIDIYPSKDSNNTIIHLKMNKESKFSYIIQEPKNLVPTLIKAGVDKYYSPLTGVRFEGTNTFVDSENIVFVKENKPHLFTIESIEDDILLLVKHRLGKL